MTKYPLTTAGSEELLKKLYNLPDNELQAEANALHLDFRGWVFSHFELSARQSVYLLNMDMEAVLFAAQTTSTAMAYRLPLSLEKEGDEEEPVLKVIDIESNLILTSKSNGNLGAAGNAAIRIHYEKN